MQGVLLLDKPLGLSSNQALQKVKWLLRAQKGGHTGTLDPAATGVLPLCFGGSTKFAQAMLEADKAYKATVRLGVITNTGDSEGEVLEQRAVHVTDEQLQAVLPRFQGQITQVPPMFSALKFQGKALYEYAREGIEIEREERQVVIRHLQARRMDDTTVELDVVCSKGTYIRTLAMDLGQALGCGASLLALQRTATGTFQLDACTTLPELEAMDEQERLSLLYPSEVLLGNIPSVTLSVQDAGRFLTGMRRQVSLPNAPLVKVFGCEPNAFLGVASVQAAELIPKRLLSPVEIQEWIEQNNNGKWISK